MRKVATEASEVEAAEAASEMAAAMKSVAEATLQVATALDSVAHVADVFAAEDATDDAAAFLKHSAAEVYVAETAVAASRPRSRSRRRRLV